MLVHVRDPLAVLEQACKVARETLILVEGSFHLEKSDLFDLSMQPSGPDRHAADLDLRRRENLNNNLGRVLRPKSPFKFNP